MNTRHPRRIVLAAALAIGLGGCNYFNAAQTHDFYPAADGTNSGPTGVGVRNALLLVDGEGGGAFFTTVVNETKKDSVATLEGSYEGQPVFNTKVPVPAEGVAIVGSGDGPKVFASNVKAPAGSIMSLRITAPGQDPITISIPVVNNSLGYFPEADAPSGGAGHSDHKPEESDGGSETESRESESGQRSERGSKKERGSRSKGGHGGH